MKSLGNGKIKLLRAERMRALDERAINEIGIPGVVLMEQAGRGAVRLLEKAGWLKSFADEITILAGKGNNGGDALVVARVLLLAGYLKVKVILLTGRSLVQGDAAINLEAFIKLGGEVVELTEKNLSLLGPALENSRVVVDGLLGTGLKSAVRGLYAGVITAVNNCPGPVLALDIPSGLDADSGLPLGDAVRATLTATFAFAKPGLFVYPGREYAGRVEIVDIGIPCSWTDDESDAIQLLTADFCRALLPKTGISANIHKGDRGHLLTFAGGPGKSGAGLLTAGAALHCGCGLSTLALPQSLAERLEGRNPAIMLEALPEAVAGQIIPPVVAEVEKICAGKNALVVGPGLGLHNAARKLTENLLKNSDLPVVLDADALTLLARDPEILPPKRPLTILTPHPGEMARLLQCDSAAVQNRRLDAVRELALKLGVYVVLKGAGTVIAAPDGALSVNASGNTLLATAGSGDLLTGIIGSFLAQGLEPLAASQTGVFLHGLLADRLLATGSSYGITVLELEQALPATLSFLAGIGQSPEISGI